MIFSEFLFKSWLFAPFYGIRHGTGYDNCIFTYKFNFLPRNYIILTFTYKTQKTAPAEYNKRHYFCTLGIYYNIIHKTYSAAVTRTYYFLMSYICKSAIHKKSLHSLTFIYIFDRINLYDKCTLQRRCFYGLYFYDRFLL